jgi:hypothetical protein
MRLRLVLPLLGAVFIVAACSEKPEEPKPKIDGIECDAKCQARRNSSGSGDFPSLDTKVIPRRNGAAPATPARAPNSNENRKE